MTYRLAVIGGGNMGAALVGGLLGAGWAAADLAIVEKKWPDAKKTATGLRYVILKEGTGNFPKSGDNVRVLYKGMLIDGSVFDEETNAKVGMSFRLGRDLVIQGWDQGLKLVKPGGKILLIIPPSLAYGTRGDDVWVHLYGGSTLQAE